MAVLALGLFSVAAAIPHEAGHIAVCSASGHGYAVGWGQMGPVVDCSQPPDMPTLYMAIGGAAGAWSLAPLAMWKRLRMSPPWCAGLLAAMYLQLAIMVLETAVTQMYLTSPFPTMAAAVSSLVVVLLVLRSFWKSRRRGAGGGSE